MEPAHGDPTLAAATDAELARCIHDGAGAAREEAELCRRMMPRVRLYGLRHLRDGDAADDLTQHVMALLLTKLRSGEVERPEAIASFVLGTARLAARDLGRAESRARRAQVQLDPADAPLAAVSAEPLDRELLQRCLAELPERDRSVVVLTFYDERTAPQIGEQLGLAAGNVRVVRLRALRRLRACLQATDEEVER